MFVPQSRSSRHNFLCERAVPKDAESKQQSLAKLKRLARYLKQWGQIFGYGRLVEEVTTFTDSDWTGWKETRKSSSAGVIMLGGHALKAYTRKQKIIARSSAEAELYAAALGSSESKGTVSLSRDLGYEMKPVLAVDAKATEHILHRQGIGKLRHIDAACLWMQDENQIQEVASTQSQERRKSCRLGNQATQQNSDCKALCHIGIHEHGREKCSERMASSGDVLGLRFSSQLTSAGSR